MRFLFQKLFQRFAGGKPPGRKGQTLVEYSLILCIISIVMIAVCSMLSAKIVVIFSAITTLLDTAQSS